MHVSIITNDQSLFLEYRHVRDVYEWFQNEFYLLNDEQLPTDVWIYSEERANKSLAWKEWLMHNSVCIQKVINTNTKLSFTTDQQEVI